MKLIIYVFLLVVLDAVGLSCAKQWEINHNNLYLIGGMVTFAAIPLVFGPMTRFSEFGVANATWAAVTALIFPIIGYLLFKEIISLWQTIGIFTIVFGLILMEIK